MTRIKLAARGAITALVLCAGASKALGGSPSYVSCVGQEWTPLVASSQGSGACVHNETAEVCRQPVENTGNATSKVTVNRGGHPVLDWLESGDPALLPRFLAFGSAHGELVVATMQSESQGMAMRDWNVAYVFASNIDAPDVVHVATAEFGALGALVKASASTSDRCSLLVTEWTSSQTKDGERLFLRGRLRPLSGLGFQASSDIGTPARFDDRIKTLREHEDPRIPLSLFDSKR